MVEQRGIGDRDHAGVRIDREGAAGIVDEREGVDVVRVVVVNGNAPDRGTVGAVLIDRVVADDEIGRRNIAGRVVGVVDVDRAVGEFEVLDTADDVGAIR
ncbi:MAG: hypothetical protein C0606_03755 [Hyphomicrobiales bacterium]|nr:MAG: hypothetical protein C0606_03755 [Hyphomicrobiales bacterium]